MSSLFQFQSYSTATPPQQVLKEVFGYDQFRSLQLDIISSVLSGRDTLAIMPTGGGKSLCYQIPALMLEGITLVVSPLIALMQDQVAGLEAAGVPAVFLSSVLEREEYFSALNRIHSGEVKLIYMSPEGLSRTERLTQLFSHRQLSLLTIDEAHCISQWGHDFRPDYRTIAQVRELFPQCPCLALTATATEAVRKDIVSSLKMNNPASFLASFDRPNIFLEVVPKKMPLVQVKKCLESHKDESGIIYCLSRKQVEELAQELKESGYNVLPYHAGLADEVRIHHQNLFIRDKVQIMVSTVAFGMGINKPNVRFVIHYDLPRSLEQYYQEIGRAGRDGELSHALLLYSAADIRKIRFFMEDKSEQEKATAERLLQEMIRYATTHRCRRQLLLSYFGEAKPVDGGLDSNQCCDICAFDPPVEQDMTIPFQKLLSCIIRTGQRYGTTYLIDVLLGSKQKRILENGHEKLSTWGIGRELDRDTWYELAECLVEYGYLKKSLDYNVLSITDLGKEALSQRQVIKLPVEGAPSSAQSVAGASGTGGAGRGSSVSALPAKKSPVFGVAALTVDKKKADAKKLKLAEDDAVGQELLQKLKDLRRRLAEDEDVPPYIIFGDVTLTALAVHKPRSHQELLEIYGIGTVKAERFGPSILRVINQVMG
ncbi:MAG: ATP-dependent DNA helicase RecQ [Treponema sp.]|nr:ATP-dependent DNA helicase RecQ [Treponema sp.]